MKKRIVALAALVFALACAAALAAPASAQSAGGTGGQTTGDAALQARVEAALAAATDLPSDSIAVQVRDGVVTLSGSVACGDCGGSATPAGSAAVQQGLGALVRAVPGVERVVFRLRYGSD